MIGIVDLGLGNVNSVNRALQHLGMPSIVTKSPKEIESCEKIILPGVGNFFEASVRLYSSGLAQTLSALVLHQKRPLLGICLGMQLLGEFGAEGGGAKGLGFIAGKVSRLRSEEFGFRLPHVGWNNVSTDTMRLFAGVDKDACFYFVHSYEFVPTENIPEVEVAFSTYGRDFVAGIKKGNVVGVQFHPEKSQKNGLQVLKNFTLGVA